MLWHFRWLSHIPPLRMIRMREKGQPIIHILSGNLGWSDSTSIDLRTEASREVISSTRESKRKGAKQERMNNAWATPKLVALTPNFSFFFLFFFLWMLHTVSLLRWLAQSHWGNDWYEGRCKERCLVFSLSVCTVDSAAEERTCKLLPQTSLLKG